MTVLQFNGTHGISRITHIAKAHLHADGMYRYFTFKYISANLLFSNSKDFISKP